MYSNKISNILYVMILFSGIISVTIASDCDILAKAFKYLKSEKYEISPEFVDQCCDFFRNLISCNGDLITEIHLKEYVNSEAEFERTIDTLTDLKSLTSLIITGTSSARGVVIPNSISKLKYLKKLDLSDNLSKSAGIPIPDIIGNLKNLEELNLCNNNYVGAIPKSIKNLKKLNKLNLSNNNLSGTIPYEFGELDNLKEINLNNNKELKGYVPLNIGFCNYYHTDLCRLKNTDCKPKIQPCTKEDIINTNKENGAPNESTYSDQIIIIGFAQLINFPVLFGIIFSIILICLCIRLYRRCTKSQQMEIYEYNTNRNSNYIPTHTRNTTIKIIHMNISSTPNNPSSY